MQGYRDSEISGWWPPMDRTQLVANELQRADWFGLRAHDGPTRGRQSCGRIWRKRSRPDGAANRMGSAHSVPAMVGRGADCHEWGGALHGGEFGVSGTGH